MITAFFIGALFGYYFSNESLFCNFIFKTPTLVLRINGILYEFHIGCSFHAEICDKKDE